MDTKESAVLVQTGAEDWARSTTYGKQSERVCRALSILVAMRIWKEFAHTEEEGASVRGEKGKASLVGLSAGHSEKFPFEPGPNSVS